MSISPAASVPLNPATDPAAAIEQRYQQIGGGASALGAPIGGIQQSGNAHFQLYSGGRIYWSPASGAHEIYGGILLRYLATGAERGPLGLPVSGEVDAGVPGSRMNLFQGGRVYWSVATGTHDVYGAILMRYLSTGAERGPLGLPVSGEMDAGVPGSRMNLFQGGRVYWSIPTGPQDVYGAILFRYLSTGAERGPLGLPVSGEVDAGVPGSRMNLFQGGRVYWSVATGPHDVYGAILMRYLSTGAERGPLGLPVSGEMNAGVPGSRMNLFQGGRVYWSIPTGPHDVYGGILFRYLSTGAERGPLGLPTSGETDWPGGRSNSFQGGRITWNASTGQTAVVDGDGSALGRRAMEIAMGRRGAPYVWGGQGPWGFDCSGLVSYAFRQAGYNLPSGSYNQYNYGRFVSTPAPGDLVFYGYRGSQHVAIYIGNGQVVQASNYNTGVHTAGVRWIGNPVAYKRIG